MIAMDRRAAVEQHYRSSGGGSDGKKRRVGLRLKRSTSVSGGKVANSHLVSGEEQQPSGAIESLAYEIDTVVQEQEEVLGLLRRKSGLFRGLGDRFKSAIRGTDGEHDLKELRQQLNWLRQKEAQLREEKLLLLIKDVSEQPSLQGPGAVAAAVATASAAEMTAQNTTPTRSSRRWGTPMRPTRRWGTPMRSAKRSGIRRSSSMGPSRSVTSGEAANDNDKENIEGAPAADFRVTQALSMRHSLGRSAPPRGGSGHERHHSRGGSSYGAWSWSSHSGLDALEFSGDGSVSGTARGAAGPGGVGKVHISSFSRAHLMSGGGETYNLGPKDGRPPLPFQSSGGVPISGSIWRRPMVPANVPATASSAEVQSDAEENFCTVAEVVAAAAAAAAAAEAAGDTGSSSPYASSGGWKLEPPSNGGWKPKPEPPTTPRLDTSQDTAGDAGWPAALQMSPAARSEVRSEMSSPARLMRSRPGTGGWEREMQDKARVVMRRHALVDRKRLPTVSHIRRNSGNWASVAGSSTPARSTRQTVTRAPPAVAAPAPPDAGTDAAPGNGARGVRTAGLPATQPELMLASPTVPRSTAAAAAAPEAEEPSAPTPPVPAAMAVGSKRVLAAKTVLQRGPSRSSFEPPCEIDRLVPAAGRYRPSPTSAAAGRQRLQPPPPLEPPGGSTPPSREAEMLEDVVEREFVQAAAVAAERTGARRGAEMLGVETLSTLPVGFGSRPGEIAETAEEAYAMFDAMVDAATGEGTVGDAGVASTVAGGNTGAKAGVEALSTLPIGFGSRPGESVETADAADAMFDAMVDAATGEATVGDVGMASTVAGGNMGAKVGVEALSTLPIGFGSTPGESVETADAADAMFDAMVDAATMDVTIGDVGLASTHVMAHGDPEAKFGVETLSTLPLSFGPKPTEMAASDGTHSMADAAAGEAWAGDTVATAPAKAEGGGGEWTMATKARRPSSHPERNPYETASAASVTTLAADATREVVSSLAVTPYAFQTPLTTPTAPAGADAAGPAPSVRPPKPHDNHLEKHPLASMSDLLTSCFAFVDATDGNPTLPEPVRKEMKRNAIGSARNTEVSKTVKLEIPPPVWVSQYEDMSKKYGLGFLLSDGSSGVTFKDGTRMVLDAEGAVFEYVEGARKSESSSGSSTRRRRGGGASSGTETGDPTSETSESEQQQRRRRRGGGRGWGRLRRIERVGYALDDYPAHYGKKVTIAQKVRELLRQAAGERDSAAGSTKALTPPGVMAILPDAVSGASGDAEKRGVGGVAASVGDQPLIFVEDWKRTRSSWIFSLSNRTLQVVFFDATEILLSEEARLITFVDKDGDRETMALLRALEEDRLDVIVRVRECHTLIKKVIRHDEQRRRNKG